MNSIKYLICILPGLLLSVCLSTSGNLQAADETTADKSAIPEAQSGQRYLPSDDPMADLAASFDAARKSDRLMLVVLGANWCHDSRALATQLYEEPLSSIVNEFYETLFVDVGYLETGRDVITSLGVPVYYATPTVLIVDPVSGQVLNTHNRHQWANAASISMEESLEYFRQFSSPDHSALQNETGIEVNLQALLTEIETFEQVQADRLYQAYAVLTPMLTAYKAGDKDAFSEDTWDEVRDYRYQVSADVENLRVEAHERVAAGEADIQLTYPVYPAFSWDPQ